MPVFLFVNRSLLACALDQATLNAALYLLVPRQVGLVSACRRRSAALKVASPIQVDDSSNKACIVSQTFIRSSRLLHGPY
jgi:hypothetical protein